MEENIIVEEVVIMEFALRGEHVPYAKSYRVHIDGEMVKVETPDPTGETLLKLAGKCSCAFELIAEHIHHDNEVIDLDEPVDLRKHGLKGFISAHKEIVIIFIGDNREPCAIERGEHSVEEILVKVGLNSTAYDLYDEKSGLPLPSDKLVSIHGCEEFITQVHGGASS